MLDEGICIAVSATSKNMLQVCAQLRHMHSNMLHLVRGADSCTWCLADVCESLAS